MHAARLTLLAVALVTLAAACWLSGCGGSAPVADGAKTEPAATAPPEATATSQKATAPIARPAKPAPPQVVLHTSAGDITLRLLPDKAPQTVQNFLHNYADRQFYDQTVFHHVEPGSMLICGGYSSDFVPKETGTPIYNESRGGLSNKRGTVAMVRDPESPHTAAAQFYFNLADNPHLDAQSSDEEDAFGYCVFAEVVAGMDVVDKIAASQATPQGDFPSVPSPTVRITSVERATQLR